MVVSGREKNFIEEIQKEIIDSSYSMYLADILEKDFFTHLGLNASQNNRLEILLEDNNIICVKEDKYEIKKDIAEFIAENKDIVLEKSKIDEQAYSKLLEELKKAKIQKIVENGNKENKKVKVRSDRLEKFKTLWETINKKVRIVYKNIDEENIIKYIKNKFEEESISEVHVLEEIKEYNAKEDKIVFVSKNKGEKIEFVKEKKYKEFVLDFLKTEYLPISFTIKLFNVLDKEKIKNNPKEAKYKLIPIIKNAIHANLLESVSYNFESEIKVTSLQNENGEYKKELKYTELGRYLSDEKPPDNYLFDSIIYDSNIEETIIKKDPREVNDNTITVFAKLPKISIPTPYKNYNPDFAYLIDRGENKKTLFLIVEAKGYNLESDIPEEEKNKIKYAEVFFNNLQKEIPDADIVFKKRINKNELHNLLTDIGGK